jgi:hypothetical protein
MQYSNLQVSCLRIDHAFVRLGNYFELWVTYSFSVKSQEILSDSDTHGQFFLPKQNQLKLFTKGMVSTCFILGLDFSLSSLFWDNLEANC